MSEFGATFDWQAVASAWAEANAARVTEALAAAAPVGAEHGEGTHEHLRDAISTEVISAAESVTLEAGSSLPEAAFLKFGTAAHEIRPTQARALFWPGAEHPVQLAHHPGTPPSDFPARALESIADELSTSLIEMALAGVVVTGASGGAS